MRDDAIRKGDWYTNHRRKMNVQSYKDTHKVKCRESTYSAGSKSEI